MTLVKRPQAMRFSSVTSRTQPSKNYPRKPMSHPKERNRQTRDAKVQLANSGPHRDQHHDKNQGTCVIPRICQSTSSLTTVKAGPHDERLYPGCVTHAIEGGRARYLQALTSSRPRAHYLRARTLSSPLASSRFASSHLELATCELSPRARHLRAHYLRTLTSSSLLASSHL